MQALSQQNARLLAHAAGLEQHNRALTSQVRHRAVSCVVNVWVGGCGDEGSGRTRGERLPCTLCVPPATVILRRHAGTRPGACSAAHSRLCSRAPCCYPQLPTCLPTSRPALQVGLLRDKFAAKVGENMQLYNALVQAKRLLSQVCVVWV